MAISTEPARNKLDADGQGAAPEVADHLDDTPSLKVTLSKSIQSAHRLARIIASRETGLAEETFPPRCPWSFEQMMADDFWPDDTG